ncbi:MAG: 30S ribosomal protein S9 [Chlamydiae bacterium]|nr:30S ribosomal protein S9 [Chlamydiota bacterium]
MKELIAIGRRKCAVASVRVRTGTGKIRVNGREVEKYFPLAMQLRTLQSPLKMFGLENKFDLVITVKGGGLEAQASATRLGVSRALVKQDDARRVELKSVGFLRRDPRKKERKKYGLAGARKSFQFSKR